MNKSLVLGAVSCVLLIVFSIPAMAQLGQDVTASWVAEVPSTPVPALGAYGALGLSIAIAGLLYRRLPKMPSSAGLLLIAFTSLGVVTAVWTTSVLSNGSVSVISIPADANCSDTAIFSDNEQVTLVNNCPDPVRVYYSVTGTSTCGLQDLSCAGSACVADGALVAANGGQTEFLGCHYVVETAPTVSIACDESSISEDGGSTECTLSLSKVWGETVQVVVAYSGSAAMGTDDAVSTAEHAIAPGETSTGWTITGLSDDQNDEGTETILIDIASVTNGTENGVQTATINITETAPSVSLSCASLSIAEDGGTSECTLTLSKTWLEPVEVTVSYSGSAAAGTDYSGGTTSHTIAAGNISESWTITGLNDSDNAESDETIVIEITGVTNGTEEGAQTTSISIPNVCAAPGTAINQSTDFRAAVSDWVANGNASEFGDITQWCTGEVTDMSFAFYNHNTVNPDISGWDTSSVTNMRLMFHFAAAFNQDIGDWDVSNVTDMEQMFKSAYAFNANIGGWDISKVTTTKEMFSNASDFNQDISGWQTGNITDPRNMFSGAVSFNQPINTNGGSWDTSSFIYTNNMFYNATAFNQDISGWNTSNVTNMGWMFRLASSFNQDLSGWDVSSVTYCDDISTDAVAWDEANKPGGICEGK